MEAKRKATTTVLYRDILHRHVLPEFGGRKAESLTAADLAKLHLKMRPTLLQANRMRAVVGSMDSFAVSRGLVAKGVNPAVGIEKYTEQGRERYLIRKSSPARATPYDIPDVSSHRLVMARRVLLGLDGGNEMSLGPRRIDTIGAAVHRASAPLGSGQRCRKLKPTIKGINAPSGLDFDVLAQDLKTSAAAKQEMTGAELPIRGPTCPAWRWRREGRATTGAP
ncbi:hypothetical protein [Xanthobacter oligotrophicus]|uniref:hypothetical protein n=1 Tax=Xanthobacter oligotrophicus TaxID=2607286 RepID=UPI0011F2D4B6